MNTALHCEACFTSTRHALQVKLKLIADSKYTVEEVLQKQQEKNHPQEEQETLEEVQEGSEDEDSDYEQPECVSRAG